MLLYERNISGPANTRIAYSFPTLLVINMLGFVVPYTANYEVLKSYKTATVTTPKFNFSTFIVYELDTSYCSYVLNFTV